MPCIQCNRPALYLVGEGDQKAPLCLACYEIVQNLQFRSWLQSAAMMNQAMDQMDAIMPIAPTQGRIPVGEIASAAFRSKTYNNIHITNSNIGVVNTGNLARIDATITITQGTDAEEFGARLKDLTDAIVNEASLSAEARQQLVEVVQAIADQAVSKTPSKIVTTTLFDRLTQLTSGVVVIADAVEKLHGAWERLQGVLGG